MLPFPSYKKDQPLRYRIAAISSAMIRLSPYLSSGARGCTTAILGPYGIRSQYAVPSTIHSHRIYARMHKTRPTFLPPPCACSLLGNSVRLSPLLRSRDSSLLILFPALRDVGSERVVRIRSTEQGLDREQDSTDLKGGRPVVWELRQ